MLLTVKTVYMKKTLFSCCVLIALLWGTTLELIAQPAQRLINVVVSPDHTDWKYKSKEEVTFTVQVKASLKEPGFLRCRVLAKVDGRQYEGLVTVAVEEEKIVPCTSHPEDFDNFWKQAIEEARKLPLDPKMILLPERCTETQNVYHISFQNHIPCSRIYGILIVPKKKGRYPAILQVPGAGIRSYRGQLRR